MGWRRAVKRVIDISSAGVGLFLLAPVLAAVSVAIRLNMGSPVLFRQKRPGLGGQPFCLNKFRTMSAGRSDDGRLLPDRDRLTKLGKFLRSTSLDELPQLWNVLVGEMSLVGPRPLLVQYLERYTAEQARRHDVLPGISGWSQVNGRNSLEWKEKLALDVWYVDHWTLRLDLEILAKTFAGVVLRRGISRDGHATMPEFMGEEQGSCR